MSRACSLAFTILLSLAHGATAQSQGPAEVRVVFVRDGVFTSPTDPAWAAIPETKHSLLAQMMAVPHGGGSVSDTNAG